MATLAAVEQGSGLRGIRVAVPLVLVAHALLAVPLGNWLIDDAAITMAYAANWTAGHGLVAQPGVPPVEGYSNPLWLVVLALLDLIGAMDPIGIKLVSFFLVAFALRSLDAAAAPLMNRNARFGVLLLVATNASLVTWTTSGLENPLTLLFACELLRVAMMQATERRAIYMGALVGLLGMTRPEGVLLGAFVALALLRKPRLLVLAGSVAVLLYAPFLIVRFATFGDVVPNTFYAKSASELKPLAFLYNAKDLMGAPFGHWSAFLAVLAGAVPAFRREARLPAAMMLVAGGLFILMPPDWMPERRFGTAFIPAACLFAGATLASRPKLLLALCAFGLAANVYRMDVIYRSPTMPMAQVVKDAERFNALGGESILLPDIGGALLTSELRVHDLAGLTDRTIARTLYRDKAAFHDHVFETLKPTYIKTHTAWTVIAQFERDPRFRRDYRPLGTVEGEFVRRDADLALSRGD